VRALPPHGEPRARDRQPADAIVGRPRERQKRYKTVVRAEDVLFLGARQEAHDEPEAVEETVEDLPFYSDWRWCTTSVRNCTTYLYRSVVPTATELMLYYRRADDLAREQQAWLARKIELEVSL